MARLAMREKAKKTPRFQVRKHNRCSMCGRPRSYIRRFGICRLCFRHLALEGKIPGIQKASW
ncbi:MAG: type Z 30S ribosomal protein S14 [Ignavibacteria bacterium]|nr:type Z 30S ribosomal protein S14 [Ignavibacteria bacterium]